MKALILLIGLSLSSIVGKTQLPPMVEDPSLFGEHGYYLKQLPKNHIINGVLVLVPGYGEHPYSVSAQSTIIQEADRNGIAVLMVNLTPDNAFFPINDDALSKLGKMIKHFYEKEKISSATPLYIGGFSIGGTAVLKFFSQKQGEFKIKKVFAIDPPLDMIRLRKSLLRSGDKNLVEKLDLLTNHKFSEHELKALSVYNPEYTTSAMLPNYKSASMRIYCEPDIIWWIKNRHMDLSDMNITDCAGYINKLLMKDADQKVELILTKDKGLRNGNQVHPHAWSIADPIDLIKWLLKE